MTTSLKSTVARKAAKATAKHTARGTASRLKHSPVRTVTLLLIGGAVGFVAGRLAAPSASP